MNFSCNNLATPDDPVMTDKDGDQSVDDETVYVGLPCVSIIEIICSDQMFEQSVELPMVDMEKSLSVQI